MITLYQFPPAYGLPVSVSPYCAKVELYLRLTDRTYGVAHGDVRKSPNKKVPYVRWPDGALEAESGAIIARLEADGPRLDDGLSEADRATGAALEARAEREIYFATLYARFTESAGWAHQQAAVRQLLPGFLAPLLLPIIRRSQVKLCRHNGFATAADYAKGTDAVSAISAALGDKPFLLGDAPRTADCAVWGQVLQCAWSANPSPPREAIRGDARLMAWLRRLAERAEIAIGAPS